MKVREHCVGLRNLNEETMYTASVDANTVARNAIWSTVLVAASALVVALAVKQHRKVTHHRRPILTPSGRVCKHPARGLCDDRTNVTGRMSFASVSSSRFLSR